MMHARTAASHRPVIVALLVTFVVALPAHAREDARAPGVDSGVSGEKPHTTGADANDDEELADVKRAVILLPLRAGTGVSGTQARGVTAQLRSQLEILDVEGVIKLLPPTREDARIQRRCKDDGQVDVQCLADAASVRGADRLGRGEVAITDDGFTARVFIIVPSGHMRDPIELTLKGEDHTDDAALDRFARELFAEESLRGHLRLKGQSGDAVFVDGRRRGTLDGDGVFTMRQLKEGKHRVVVRRPEGRNGLLYDDFERDVVIHHNEEADITVTLLPRDGTARMGAEADTGPPIAGIATASAGGVLMAVGAVFGALSLMDSLDVEDRAEAQQLVFPRDTELVQRGQTFALVANIFYGVGVVGAGIGGALIALHGAGDGEADEAALGVGGAR